MKLSISFFGSGQEGVRAPERYETVLALGRLADILGLHAVWVPERHFQDFGDLFPQPAVLAAALAATTERVGIRAGSVVLPLHHPIRVLEDWSMVDAISHGRVGVSVASGWHPQDFVLAPDAFADRRESTADGLSKLRRSWRSGLAHSHGPDGRIHEVPVRPARVQKDLPLWLTTSGRPQTWVSAGRLGVSVLASTIGQTPESLAENIAEYRAAFDGRDGGRPWVTLVVHTYVGEDRTEVRRQVEGPMKRYLASFVAQSATSADRKAADLGEASRAQLLDFAFERYWSSLSMFGPPRHCAATLSELEALGCDEVACLVDFGPSRPEMERTLTLLSRL